MGGETRRYQLNGYDTPSPPPSPRLIRARQDPIICLYLPLELGILHRLMRPRSSLFPACGDNGARGVSLKLVVALSFFPVRRLLVRCRARPIKDQCFLFAGRDGLAIYWRTHLGPSMLTDLAFYCYGGLFLLLLLFYFFFFYGGRKGKSRYSLNHLHKGATR